MGQAPNVRIHDWNGFRHIDTKVGTRLYTLRLNAAFDSPLLLVTMRAYWPASAVDTSITSSITLLPELVILCFIGASFTSLPSFIQLTVAGGPLTAASKDAAVPRVTVRELGKLVNTGAWTSSPGTSTTREQVEKHSPMSLKASQV